MQPEQSVTWRDTGRRWCWWR